MKTKQLAVIESTLIILSAVLIIYASSGSCNPSLVYPIIMIVAVQIIGIVVMFVFYLKMSAKRRGLPDPEKVRERIKLKNEIKKLKSSEKKLYDIIRKSDGVISQGDIVIKTGLSKVKVTRILNRLERKDLIERRRKGLRNIVLLRDR